MRSNTFRASNLKFVRSVNSVFHFALCTWDGLQCLHPILNLYGICIASGLTIPLRQRVMWTWTIDLSRVRDSQLFSYHFLRRIM